MTESRTTAVLSYPPERDAVFIFGAGASAPDGVPLQRDLLPYVASSEDKILAKSWMGSGLRDFLWTWFDAEVDQGLFPTLEEVFGLLDYHIRSGESLSDDLSVLALAELRRSLIACIHYAIHVASASDVPNYSAFWNLIAEKNRNIGVVTLNYDVALEQAFDPLYSRIAVIDYCLHLLNYDLIFDEPSGVPGYWWWENPRGPVSVWNGQAPHPIKILKLHGSLNWKYCPTCRGVLLSPWETAIDLDDGIFRWAPGASCGDPHPAERDLKCPYDSTHFETLIVPPSHGKRLDHPALGVIASEAIREIRAAKRVVFVGYSFPEADVHLRSFLARAIRTDAVTVVDPGLSPQARARYQSVCGNPEFLDIGFAEFIGSGAMEERLFATSGPS